MQRIIAEQGSRDVNKAKAQKSKKKKNAKKTEEVQKPQIKKKAYGSEDDSDDEPFILPFKKKR